MWHSVFWSSLCRRSCLCGHEVLGLNVAIVLLALLTGGLGCARNPVTGRPDAVLTSEKGEIDQGNEAAKIVEQQIGFVDDPDLQAYVDALGQRLAGQSPRSHLNHTFHVVNMKEPNAFALPGGHVYVSRGLLELINSEDELAMVIGHEIGHVAARHSVTRQAANAPLAPVRILAGIGGAAASILSPSIGRIVSGVGQLPGALALAAYSRDQERNADRLGQDFGAAEGFDPNALSTFMDTLARNEELAGGDPNQGSFFLSHPQSPERSRDAIEHAKLLTHDEVDPQPLTRAALLAKLEGLVVGESSAEGVFIDQLFLQADLGIAITFPEGWETLNSPNAVAAIQKDKLGQVVVEIVAEGSDPMEQALAFDREIRLSQMPSRLDIGGLSAVQAECETGRWGDKMHMLMTWIAHRGHIYRVTGGAAPRQFEPLRATFVTVAGSFHELSEAEREEIKEDHLQIATARPGEDLEALGKRTANRWSVEETAVANALDPEAVLEPRSLIKISRAEPYTAKTRDPAE